MNNTNDSMEQSGETSVGAMHTYTFNQGDTVFRLDHEQIAEVLSPGNAHVIDMEVLANTVSIMTKDLVHRSSWAKGLDAKGQDATERFIDAMLGAQAAGRFKVTQADKDRAERAMKGYKMAPKQTTETFFTNNGVEYQDDAEWLAKHYMGLRAKKAAEEKAAKNML